MEPQIRFCTSADGTRIAYATMGEGRPMLYVPGWMGNVERDSAFLKTLGLGRLLVSFDRRGTGASQRDVDRVSLETEVADVVAVVDCLELTRFDLFGVGEAAAVSLAYAVQHADRVSRLILWCSYPCGEEIIRPEAARTLVELIRGNWSLARRALADVVFPDGPTEMQRWLSNSFRESVSPDVAAKHVQFHADVDVRSYLSQVKTPTLVLHRRGDRMVPISAGRQVAASIPDARLIALEGTSSWVTGEDAETMRGAIHEFLGEGEEAAPTPELPEGMAVLLFADIAESTALTEQLGDSGFRARARELDTSLREVIRESGGTPVEGKVLGDGVLAVFTSARQAIEAALRCGTASEPTGLRLHVGIHAGDVIREGNNVYGGAVNIAARIATASAPGEVLVSDTVRSLARTSAGVTFDDRGQRKLKGVEGRQRLFAVKGGADG